MHEANRMFWYTSGIYFSGSTPKIKHKTFQWYHILIVPKGDINKHYVQINNKYSFHLQNSVNEHDFLSVIEILQIINMTKIYEAVNSFIIVHAL